MKTSAPESAAVPRVVPRAVQAAAIALCLLVAAPVLAQPYVPEDNQVVIMTLPAAVVDLSRQLRAAELRQTAPDTGQLINDIAAAYRLAASTQEARAYGRVMTLLQQWPAQLHKPVLIRLISAAVLQHSHNFDTALAELDAVLADNPADVQAHMIRAQIGLVSGQYTLTQQSCNALQGLVTPALHLNCQAQLDGVSGRAVQALNSVTSLLAGSGLLPADRMELQITGAVLAHRLAQSAVAESLYLNVLLQSPQHRYTLVHYANLLLENNRHQDVIRLIELLPEDLRNAEIKVLLAEALIASHDIRAAQLVQNLAEDFELAFLRTDAVPHKEFARYALRVVDKPEAALQSARLNWNEQKEPSDALLLAMAAVAASDHGVLRELHQWIRARGTEDKQLQAIFAEQGLLL